MKRGTEHLLKFKKLKQRLGLSTWETKGLLQSIWDLATENAILGDVGRWSDEDIAFGIEYGGDARSLIAALVDCGWLDAHPTHRLVIHDWLEHCEDWVKKRIMRERGLKTWAEYLELEGANRHPAAAASREEPEGQQTTADSVRQNPPRGRRRPTESATRQTVADKSRQCPPLSACHSHSHSHSLGHSPTPPVAPLAGGDVQTGNGNGKRRRTTASDLARDFVAHVYAAWAGSEHPAGPVLEKEALAAEPLLALARDLDPEGSPETWAEAFAEHVLAFAPTDDKARASVALALPRYSATFVADLQRRRQEQRKCEHREAREAHREEYLPRWLEYVRETFATVEAEAPERCQVWLDRLKRQLGRQPTEDERLARFVEDARKSGDVEVLEFWEWDEEINPFGLEKQEAKA